MTHYWFRPKSFGYGATPVTWQGWALTLGGALVLAACVVTGLLAVRQRWPHEMTVMSLCGGMGAATLVVLVTMSRVKTEGAWRWRG